MPALRETIRPILFIVVAASIVVLLIAPLYQTQWAAGMRAGAASDVGEGVKGSDPSGAIRFIGPLLKIAILMGVPALVTLGIRRLIRRFFRRATQQ
ncbi:hypothetical protein [Allorhodopirellula heiligendammensis]|uniref:Uncharacterized protein n=1 Tax=Allorhodopirellula heiligendammensis TaxID=2714739 RepID=A0A5C6C131_9BACT|nr:hypothetical protein [Allorhodopirellula heiligendammensis]TWU18260.1 hypothetical protein Poly21_04150 [Allorhodopirellula heiligendammensis]